jgi:hypothetical protein
MKQTLFLLLLCIGWTACSTERDEVRVRLTLKERELVDELVGTHMDSLRPILDSMCVSTTADRVAVATDSIVQRRLEEEARLRSRIPQNKLNGQ